MLEGKVVTGSGNVQSESRDVSGFRGVVLAGIGEVTLEQTGTESLSIEAEDNLLPELTTHVVGETLMIRVAKHVRIIPTRHIRFRISVIALNTLELSGFGTVEGSRLDAEPLTVRMTGSGRIALQDCPVSSVTLSGAGDIHASGVNVPELAVTLSGAGRLTLSGQTDSQTVNLPGSGAYRGENLLSVDTRVNLSGLGSASVNASGTLWANVSGLGMIEYTGNPVVTKKISGLGTIRQRQKIEVRA